MTEQALRIQNECTIEINTPLAFLSGHIDQVLHIQKSIINALKDAAENYWRLSEGATALRASISQADSRKQIPRG